MKMGRKKKEKMKKERRRKENNKDDLCETNVNYKLFVRYISKWWLSEFLSIMANCFILIQLKLPSFFRFILHEKNK